MEQFPFKCTTQRNPFGPAYDAVRCLIRSERKRSERLKSLIKKLVPTVPEGLLEPKIMRMPQSQPSVVIRVVRDQPDVD